MLRYSDQADLNGQAEMLKAIASDVRLQILHWLKDPHAHFASRRPGDLSEDGGVCVSLIAEKAGVAQPTASRHLEVLRRAGLISTTRVANWNFHYRNEAGLTQLRQALEGL